MLALRERIGAEARLRAAQQCAAQLLKLVPAQAIVGGFVSCRGEIDLSETMRQLGERGHSLCLPVIESSDKPLYFRKWRVGEAFETGRYGISVPVAGAPVLRPEVLLVPMVAFDRRGHRLGYGAGYYDRTIARLREVEPSLLTIGVAFSEQEVERIPEGDHDQVLDMIVTDKEVIKGVA